MPRVYKRKFDWDEARRRHAAGESYSEIARALGVSSTAVFRVCSEGARERMDRQRSEWSKTGTCVDCGVQCSRTRKDEARRCMPCSARFRATSVREDTLWCSSCQTWKGDADFPNNSNEPARRYRHACCRPCLTRQRREYRQRNPERERAYEQEYSKVRRQRRRERMTPLQRATSAEGL